MYNERLCQEELINDHLPLISIIGLIMLDCRRVGSGESTTPVILYICIVEVMYIHFKG